MVQQSKPVKQEKVMATSKIAKVRIGQNEGIMQKTAVEYSVYLVEIRKFNCKFSFMN